jgi:dihydroxyacetone kinase-like protein
LLGTFYLEAAKKCDPVFEISDDKVVECFEAGLAGIMFRGKAVVGEKTMVDAMVPAVEVLKEKVAAGSSLKEAFTAATVVAYAAAVKTADYAAQKGRASYLGDRSIGHQDPGAVSTAIYFDTFARNLE